MRTGERTTEENIVGKRIKRYRVVSELNQQDLADLAGYSRVSIGNYERGKRMPKANIIQQLADVCHVPLFGLLDLTKDADRFQLYLFDVMEKEGDDVSSFSERTGIKEADLKSVLLGEKPEADFLDKLATHLEDFFPSESEEEKRAYKRCLIEKFEAKLGERLCKAVDFVSLFPKEDEPKGTPVSVCLNADHQGSYQFIRENGVYDESLQKAVKDFVATMFRVTCDKTVGEGKE